MSLDDLITEVSSLKRRVINNREKPHKLLLLLAVFDLLDSGKISENRIYYDDQLGKAFREQFNLLADAGDWMQISQPFFHLRSSSFWEHEIKPGRKPEYDKISTPGGGSKKITENIDFARFSDKAWLIIKEQNFRTRLRETINSMIVSQKLGTAFHEQFKLNRNGLAQMLRVVENNKPGNTLVYDDFKQATTLGNNQVKSYRNYLKASGLTNEDLTLTPFGQTVVENDSSLSEADTQWCLHYGMSVSHMPGPLYWNRLVNEGFTPGRPVSSSHLADDIREITTEGGAAPLAPDTYREAAAVFIGTYSDLDSLGSLGILEEAEGRSQYTVRQPRALSVGAFACLLADYWQRHWPDRADVLLEQVTQGELARVLLLSENKVNDLLGSLAAPDMALVKRQRKHLPYQIIRQPSLDAATLWQTHLYR
ncbi:DUF4007 family protein [Hymenobacter sp. IS2118]|uniref:DUF4007 family protein n=1 Tax=Hymenobacter sp. IS2118 TaxID=1505605 RepID=UPI00090700FE|nr:DUF4007 family protein [Hymenobacter sp. IS2118]